jgi:HEAT repeat protein
MSFLQGLFGPPDVENLKSKRDIKGLEKALTYQQDENIRSSAAKALGELKSMQSVESLITTLKDNEWHVRKAAATALGQIGDARAVYPLISTHKHVDVRNAAIDALAKIGVPAVESLLTAINNEHKEIDLRRMAISALGKIRDTRAVEPLIAALRNGDINIVWDAAEALGKIGDTRAVEPLIVVLENIKNGFVRKTVIKALGLIGDVRAVKPLIAVLSVDATAADALGLIGDARAVEPLIAALRGNREVRIKAANVLVNMYQSSRLDDFNKNLILQQRENITDPFIHTDYASCGESHQDKYSGIGVDFPL